jgi:hypothetical protein
MTPDDPWAARAARPEPEPESGWVVAVLGKESQPGHAWRADDEGHACRVAANESARRPDPVTVWYGDRSVAVYAGGELEYPAPRPDAVPPPGAPVPIRSQVAVQEQPAPPPPAVDEVELVMTSLRELVERGNRVRPGTRREDLPRTRVLGGEALLFRSGDGALHLQVEGPDEDLDTVLGVVGPYWQYVAVVRRTGLAVFQIPPDEPIEPARARYFGVAVAAAAALLAETWAILTILLLDRPRLWVLLVAVAGALVISLVFVRWARGRVDER